MDSSASVNHDHLYRFMVKINPTDKGNIVRCKADIVVQKNVYFLFVINLITKSKKMNRTERSLKICGTMHCPQSITNRSLWETKRTHR